MTYLPQEKYRSNENLMNTIFLGLIWLTHTIVPLSIYLFGVNHLTATKWEHIAWKSFAYSRTGLYSIMTLFWITAYISSDSLGPFFARIYFHIWVFVQSAASISCMWFILAFFIAACAGGKFETDFSLLLGVISYNSLFLYLVYNLFNSNQLYFGWAKSRDDIVRYIFPSWNPDWEDQLNLNEQTVDSLTLDTDGIYF